MSLDRFIKAHEDNYDRALKEIKNGRKTSHWMWYIFPQIKGLGFSETARYYEIRGRKEAEEYMAHPVLSRHLFEISEALLSLECNDARKVMGYPDDMKLKSSMTLFYLVSKDNLFKKVLEKFFDGEMDDRTEVLI